MLHFRQENFVAALDVFGAPGGCDKIDSFGGATSENDFIGAAGVDELRGTGPRGFESAGSAIAEFMNAAVNVGVVALVILDEGIYDSARLLGGGGIIEVNERTAMHLLIQNGEVGSESRPIHGSGLRSLFFCFGNHENYNSPNWSLAA